MGRWESDWNEQSRGGGVTDDCSGYLRAATVGASGVPGALIGTKQKEKIILVGLGSSTWLEEFRKNACSSMGCFSDIYWFDRGGVQCSAGQSGEQN